MPPWPTSTRKSWRAVTDYATDMNASQPLLVHVVFRFGVGGLENGFVNHYIALSQHLAEYLEDHVGVPDEAISQVYNGVDTERFYPGAGDAIAGCPFRAPDHWLIGSVGRLEAIKDPLNLARAFIRAL